VEEDFLGEGGEAGHGVCLFVWFVFLASVWTQWLGLERQDSKMFKDQR
jgi:hypothetical protein